MSNPASTLILFSLFTDCWAKISGCSVELPKMINHTMSDNPEKRTVNSNVSRKMILGYKQ